MSADALFGRAAMVMPNEDGPMLLDATMRFVRRFVVVGEDALLAIALWILHSHAIDAADATPYLNIGSPQRQCGKTRLLEVLRLLVARPFFTGRTTAAALVRKVSKDSCTLLLDETDAAFAGDQEYSQALRQILNMGAFRGNPVTLCVGRDHAVKDFPVFGPKAIAGIGKIPDTVADRSIRIELARKKRTECAERFRLRKIVIEAEELRERIERWAKQNVETLRLADPPLPEISDRAQDGWEPLLAIADLCRAGDRARRAAITLTGAIPEAEDRSERTLLDCKLIFDTRGTDRLPSAELTTELRKIDDGPYEGYRGKEFDERSLARRLSPYRIGPKTIRVGNATLRGYLRAHFEDAWTRYVTSSQSLPIEEQQVQQAQHDEAPVRNAADYVADITGPNSAPTTALEHGVADVADVAVPADMPNQTMPLVLFET